MPADRAHQDGAGLNGARQQMPATVQGLNPQSPDHSIPSIGLNPALKEYGSSLLLELPVGLLASEHKSEPGSEYDTRNHTDGKGAPAEGGCRG